MTPGGVGDRAPSWHWFAVLPPDTVPSRDAVRRAARLAGLHAPAGPLPFQAPASGEPASGEPAAHGIAAVPADDAAHDRYFAILRVAHPTPAAFLHSMRAAASLLQHEVTCGRGGPPDSNCTVLAAGFAALLADCTGSPSCNAPGGGGKQADHGDTPPTPAATPIDAMHRWRLGHQIFTAVTQGLIYALQAFETAMRDVDMAATAVALDLATALLLATAAGFRFTGDFSPDAYRRLIRPTMAPPHVGAGFSGLLSADHRHLVVLLSRLRPLMQQAAHLLPAPHARLTGALQRVYDDHRLVCARFGGAEVPSLRKTACRQGTGVESTGVESTGVESTGVEQLDKFARARLRLVAAPAGRPALRP